MNNANKLVEIIKDYRSYYERQAAAARGKSPEDDETAYVYDEIARALTWILQDWTHKNV